MIFDSDDNDEILDWDSDGNDSSPTQPSTPSSPAPRAPRNPFGAKDEGAESDNNKPAAGSLPARKPASPFGQNPGGSRVSRPERPLPTTKPPVSPASPLPTPTPPPTPFSRPVPQPPIVKEQQTLPSQPRITPYTQSTEPEAVPQPEPLSEAELLLRSIREDAQLRAAKAREAEEAARALAAETPSAPAVPESPQPVVAPVAEPEPVEDKKKVKKGFFSSKPKKSAPAPKKGKKADQEPKENQYAGDRKKILYIRLVAGSVAAIVGIAGLQAIFMPNSGPSKAQVMAAAQQAVNYTGFPTVSGEQFSIDFARAYFNYNSQDQNRQANLTKFASPDLVKQIDAQIMSPQEYDAQKKVGQPDYSNYTVSQSVTYGPYVVATNNLTATSAVFTVKVGLNSGSVLYLDVPVKYDPKAYSLTLAGPPNFSKPIQNQGAATKDQWTATFANGSDDSTAKTFQPDLSKFLAAWALSDSTTISRFVLDSATDNAKKGLQGAVQFDQILSLSVEPADPNNPATATQRRVEVNVLWQDPTTGVRYPQEYRMLIGLNPDKKWAVYDIENFDVLNSGN